MQTAMSAVRCAVRAEVDAQARDATGNNTQEKGPAGPRDHTSTTDTVTPVCATVGSSQPSERREKSTAPLDFSMEGTTGFRNTTTMVLQHDFPKPTPPYSTMAPSHAKRNDERKWTKDNPHPTAAWATDEDLRDRLTLEGYVPYWALCPTVEVDSAFRKNRSRTHAERQGLETSALQTAHAARGEVEPADKNGAAAGRTQMNDAAQAWFKQPAVSGLQSGSTSASSYPRAHPETNQPPGLKEPTKPATPTIPTDHQPQQQPEQQNQQQRPAATLAPQEANSNDRNNTTPQRSPPCPRKTICKTQLTQLTAIGKAGIQATGGLRR